MGQLKIKPHYNTIIIGGGIVGAGIFRDLSLHQISTLLIEKGDFSSQTSQSSSKMLHGGIRYLEQMEFNLIRESLHEKNLWVKNAPHLCFELPFCFPIYKEMKRPLWQLSIGLKIYDALSGFKNTPHYILNKKKTIQNYPQLKPHHLTGSGVYFDAVMDDAKLTLENIYDGLINPECEAINYSEVNQLTKQGLKYVVEYIDVLDGIKNSVTCDQVVVACGPFTDIVMKKLLPSWRPRLLLSKGVHLWIKPEAIPIKSPIVLQSKDNRVIFVIPQRDCILVGTTESEVHGNFFNLKAEQSDVDYLLNCLSYYFQNQVTASDVLSTFAGVRPLIKEEGTEDRSNTSREHQVFQPYPNMYVIAGGKYTSFRTMGQDVSSQLVQKAGTPYSPSKTQRPLRVRSLASTFNQQNLSPELIQKIIKIERVRTFQDLMQRRLAIPGPKHWNHHQSLESFVTELRSNTDIEIPDNLDW